MTKVTIWKAENGYIIKSPSPCGDGTLIEVSSVSDDGWLEKKEAGERAEAEALADILWKVIAALAPTELNSRYSSARVRVVIEPGDKYEDANEVGREDLE